MVECADVVIAIPQDSQTGIKEAPSIEQSNPWAIIGSIRNAFSSVRNGFVFEVVYFLPTPRCFAMLSSASGRFCVFGDFVFHVIVDNDVIIERRSLLNAQITE